MAYEKLDGSQIAREGGLLGLGLYSWYSIDYPSQVTLCGSDAVSRSLQRAVTTFAFGFAALIASQQIALAQAGSIGGTVGKTDKSISGGVDAGSSNFVLPEKPRASGFTASSISGPWRYQSKCIGFEEPGTFDIHPTSSTEFDGEYFGTGKILHGKINGNRVSFVGRYILDRTWTGTISGSGAALRMVGSFTGPTPGQFSGDGNCKFTATRN